jgi:hypothetical protein
MAGHLKYYELLDIPKFALPDVSAIQARPTATNLIERLTGGGFMSYSKIWPRLDIAVKGLATDQYIRTEFSAYKDEWKNRAIQDAVYLLRDFLARRGNWYRTPNNRQHVLGCWFKNSIKGFWASDGKVYAVLINCRKRQPLNWEDIRFLARGIYELYCIDDPNDPIPLIIDLALHSTDVKRKARIYEVPITEAIPIEGFEHSMREFLVASSMAGISQPPPPDLEHILDLFRR